jgi:hypothetical protein
VVEPHQHRTATSPVEVTWNTLGPIHDTGMMDFTSEAVLMVNRDSLAGVECGGGAVIE